MSDVPLSAVAATVEREPITLSDAQLARLAEMQAPLIAAELYAMLAPLIAEELHAMPAAGPELEDAGAIARRFSLTAEWVRDHADELGAIRLGDGERPRLRFDPAEVREALRRRSRSVRSPAADLPVPAEDSRPVGSDRAGNAAETLPVRQLTPAITELSSLGTRQIVAPRRVNARGPATRSTASPRLEDTRVAGSPVGSASSRRSDRKESP